MKKAVFLTGAIVILGIALSGCSSASSGQEADQGADQNTQDQTQQPVDQDQGQQDNITAEKKNALKKAETYSDIMHMCKAAIGEQLTSEYGEQFSPEAAQYAMDNIQADWDANALAQAKNFQDTMSMSPAGIHDQLTSDYGSKCTSEQADYAIAHLND